jgi:hypothetical protein
MNYQQINNNNDNPNIFYLQNNSKNQEILLQYILDYLDYCVNNNNNNKFRPEKTCVFLDIDGTILYTINENKNPPNDLQNEKQQKQYYKSITSCISVIHDIFVKCNKLNIKVFLITARVDTPEIRKYTMKQLECCNYYHLDNLTEKSGLTRTQYVNQYKQQQNQNQKQKKQQKQQKQKLTFSKPFYYELVMLPPNLFSQLSKLKEFNFSSYKLNARQKLMNHYKVIPLLCIGDQWFDVIYIPSSRFSSKTQDQQKKKILSILFKQLMPFDLNQIFIMTGVDVSWLSIKLPTNGLITK